MFIERGAASHGPAVRMWPTAAELGASLPRLFTGRPAAAARETSVVATILADQEKAAENTVVLLEAALWARPGFPTAALPPGGRRARLREVAYVHALLDTRIFSARGGAIDEAALIPVIDLVNHRPHSPIVAAQARKFDPAFDADDAVALPRAAYTPQFHGVEGTTLWDRTEDRWHSVGANRSLYRLHAWTLITEAPIAAGEEVFTT